MPNDSHHLTSLYLLVQSPLLYPNLILSQSGSALVRQAHTNPGLENIRCEE
jgi:hypothetical protein